MGTVVAFAELRGKTLKRVVVASDNSSVTLACSCGQEYLLQHQQSCCESVELADVVGDLQDLLDAPLLLAEEVSQQASDGNAEEGTWTFYKLVTVRGAVTLRWWGTSNGYYSEDVSCWRMHDDLYLAQRCADDLSTGLSEAAFRHRGKRL